MPDDDGCLLAVPGESDAPVTVGEVNRLVRLLNRLHMAPIREQLQEFSKHMRETREHQEREALVYAKILGGMALLKFLGALMVGLVVVIGGLITMYVRLHVIINGP